MPAAAELDLSFGSAQIHVNLSTSELIESALINREGSLTSSGALVCLTGARTGRSPKDKFLEDTSRIHKNIDWGSVNRPVSESSFDHVLALVNNHLSSRKNLWRFDGSVGASKKHRLGVTVVTEEAWHCLFAKNLFIRESSSLERPSWTVLHAGNLQLDNYKELGLNSPIGILQSLERRIVLVTGTRYAGEIKKSMFYAMNYDMPEEGVVPMHCSANVCKKDAENVALFFGLSGTGKTTLSADPNRYLVGDDEHGWGDDGIFNFEGGCYAKCIDLTKEGEPEIYKAISYGTVLENVVTDSTSRDPIYNDNSCTENTRAAYELNKIDGSLDPSLASHPKQIIFLTADAFGVLPPVARLDSNQARYYFINGYTSKLAGTEAGISDPEPNFSPCFGGPFLPRPPALYAKMLADRIEAHGASVWLVNTGWSGGSYGEGSRIDLSTTRFIIDQITSGNLGKSEFIVESAFGLSIPKEMKNIPQSILDPKKSWDNFESYNNQARKLASLFRKNDKRFDMENEVRKAGPPISN